MIKYDDDKNNGSKINTMKTINADVDEMKVEMKDSSMN